jgi:hypothetical protein
MHTPRCLAYQMHNAYKSSSIFVETPLRGHLAGVADLAHDGGDVDDAAGLLLQHDLGRLLPFVPHASQITSARASHRLV